MKFIKHLIIYLCLLFGLCACSNEPKYKEVQVPYTYTEKVEVICHKAYYFRDASEPWYRFYYIRNTCTHYDKYSHAWSILGVQELTADNKWSDGINYHECASPTYLVDMGIINKNVTKTGYKTELQEVIPSKNDDMSMSIDIPLVIFIGAPVLILFCIWFKVKVIPWLNNSSDPVPSQVKQYISKPSNEDIVFHTSELLYFVYKYTFPDGKVYIGRSKNRRNRYGNSYQYRNQRVYKHMQKYPNYKKEIVMYSENIYKVAEYEHNLICKTWKYNLNVSKEYNWKKHVKKELKS